MAEPRGALERLAMVIAGFLVLVIALTYGGYFYKELRYKNRQAESARKYAEVRDKAQREVEAMTVDQAIDAVPTAQDYYRWEFLEGRLMADHRLWKPTSEAEQARLGRAITALAAVRNVNLGGLVDQILAADAALQPRLRDALVAGLATEKIGPRSDVATLLFEKGGASWLTPAIPALQLTPDAQARIVRELLERHTPQGKKLVLAWIAGGLVTTTAEYPRSLVDDFKRGWSDWEEDAKPDDRAFARELEAAEKAAAKPIKQEKKP